MKSALETRRHYVTLGFLTRTKSLIRRSLKVSLTIAVDKNSQKNGIKLIIKCHHYANYYVIVNSQVIFLL